MKWLGYLFFPLVLFASEPFFVSIEPPKGWAFADPSKYKDGVKVALIASTKKIFTPSLTLAVEHVGKASIQQYVEALKEIYQRDHFQKLGTFPTAVGTAHLFQIDRESPSGTIRIFQAINLHEGYALIQTGACLKEKFLDVHETYLNAFKSLQATPSILTSCSDPSFKSRLEQLIKHWDNLCLESEVSKASLFVSPSFQNNHWKPFVNYVESALKSKTACWRLLAIKHIQENLLLENAL